MPLSPAEEMPAGALLFRRGDPVEHLYLVASGTVLLRAGTALSRDRALGWRGPMALLAAAGALLGGSHAMTAVCATPTRVHRLSAHRFRQFSRGELACATFIACAVSLETDRCEADLMRGMLESPEERMVSLLAALGPADAADVVTVPDTIQRHDLAELLHVNPQSLDRLLDTWTLAQMITRSHDGVQFRRSAFQAGVTSAKIVSFPSTSNISADAQVAIQFVRDHYAHPNLTLAMVSRHVERSTWHLSRCFREATGMRFRQFVLGVRMRRAQYLLASTSLLVKQIAPAVGYVHTSHFARDFASVVGQSPTEYKRLMRSSAPVRRGPDRQPADRTARVV